MGSCLEVHSKTWKACFPPTSLQVRSNCFDTFQMIGGRRGWFDGTPCVAKQAGHYSGPLFIVWIFTYSCLWHADSSWWARAPTDTLVPRLDRSCSTRAKAGSRYAPHPQDPTSNTLNPTSAPFSRTLPEEGLWSVWRYRRPSRTDRHTVKCHGTTGRSAARRSGVVFDKLHFCFLLSSQTWLC